MNDDHQFDEYLDSYVSMLEGVPDERRSQARRATEKEWHYLEAKE